VVGHCVSSIEVRQLIVHSISRSCYQEGYFQARLSLRCVFTKSSPWAPFSHQWRTDVPQPGPINWAHYRLNLAIHWASLLLRWLLHRRRWVVVPWSGPTAGYMRQEMQTTTCSSKRFTPDVHKVKTLGAWLGVVRNPEACAFKGAIVQTPMWDLEPHQQSFPIRTSCPTCRFLCHQQCARGPLSVPWGMATNRYRLNQASRPSQQQWESSDLPRPGPELPRAPPRPDLCPYWGPGSHVSRSSWFPVPGRIRGWHMPRGA
jgi:hypothetical protein